MNFYETINIFEENISPNSPHGKVLQFLAKVKMHKDFNYLWEKCQPYIEVLENLDDEEYQNNEEESDNNMDQ